jgi:sugar phosphate isomerase/epimerase
MIYNIVRSFYMRLGGPIHEKYEDPEQYVNALKKLGYTASFCPVSADKDVDEIQAYRKAADEAGIVIAEVGAWSNPLSRSEEEKKTALNKCKTQLALAEEIGANCCVNIAGSRGEKWDGPCRDDLTSETFDAIVETVREIIDHVKPTRTFYTLETMPWMYPDSVESYKDLIKAIDREAFAAHFDPVNIINCPERFFNNGELIKEFCKELGPHIKSCHAKDIALADNLTVHLDEAVPGTGSLDYAAYLCAVEEISPDMPVMLEHIKTPEDYKQAAEYVRGVADKEGIIIK